LTDGKAFQIALEETEDLPTVRNSNAKVSIDFGHGREAQAYAPYEGTL